MSEGKQKKPITNIIELITPIINLLVAVIELLKLFWAGLK